MRRWLANGTYDSSSIILTISEPSIGLLLENYEATITRVALYWLHLRFPRIAKFLFELDSKGVHY